ncbi:MAG TPA: MFS transporter, partial [Blastocatellia bacterium]|nr:MFS transporter [Blastocatellia bacterium]
EILRSPRVWRFIPAWLAVFAIIGMWSNHGMGLLKGEGVATEKIGNVSAILTVLFAVGVLVWSFNLARYRKTSVMLVAMGGLFVALAAGYGLNHPSPVADALFYPMVGALLIGLFVLSGFTPAALTYLADVTEAHAGARGSIMGLYSVFLGVGQVIGITTGGFFATWAGIDGLLLLSAVFGVLTAFTLTPLRRQEVTAEV